MKKTGLAILLLAAAVMLSACGALKNVNSGVEGQALIGPMCPIARPGQDCPDKPYQATIGVRPAGRGEVAQFETDSEGRFRMPLPPGSYTLVPKSKNAVQRAAEVEVTVVKDQYTEVTIHYDSGIR